MEGSLAKECSQPVLKRPESFRASCDNCAKSKVRCGKEKPRCQRCIYQGGNCVYSPSQRSRKRRRFAVNQTSRREPVHSPTLSAQSAPQGNVSPITPAQSEASPTYHVTSSSQARITDTIDRSEIERTPVHHHDPFPSLNLFDADLDSLIDLGYVIAPPARHGQKGASILSDHLQTQQWLQCGSISPSCLEDEDKRDIFYIPDDQMIDADLPNPLAEPRYSTDIHASQVAHQHWSSLASSTLQSVDYPTACCSSSTLHLDPSPTNGQSRSLDTVLRANRAAIDNVLTILNCPCSADTDLALLVTIIVFKVLSWYEASLRCSRGSADSSMAGSTTTNSPFASLCGTHESSPAPTVESVLMAPMSVGEYQLDNEYRGRMIAQLILTDLVKLNQVVDGFSRKYSRSRLMSAEDSRTQLHVALEMFLRSRLKMTALAARQQLDMC